MALLARRRDSRFVNQCTLYRFFITQGIVGRWGRVVAAGRYVGEDMIVRDYVRNYAVSTLSYVDAFRLERDAVFELLENDKFPRVGVRRCCSCCCCS